MTQQTIFAQLQTAIKQLKSGTFNGNVVTLLERVAKRFEQRIAREKEVKLNDTKAVYEAYREMHDKLQEIGRAFVESRVPNAQVIYLTKWSYHDGRNNGNEVLNLDLEYRRKEVEDGEEADQPDGYDSLGEGYVRRSFNVYVKPEWLWMDGDELWHAVKLAGLEAELERAQKRADALPEVISKSREHTEELGGRLGKTVEHVHNLQKQIDALKGMSL
jgi:hypothetical protein